MNKNPLKQLGALGQSVWLDYISRELLLSGELRRLIQQDGLMGMTSNPAIFEKTIDVGTDYDADIEVMASKGMEISSIYEALTQRDVQMAADEFLPVYKKTAGKDGYVSLEVNPHLAHDTKGTITEARRLWRALHRPNVFIKVPATTEGLPVITQLISEGINVNVTLLFGLPRYRQVVECYLAGIEARVAQGKDVGSVASVASFFVSRIDTAVDSLLDSIIALGGNDADLAQQLRGKVAIASAQVAYRSFKELFDSDRFNILAKKGARPQRVLWASTGTKNPQYSDVKYVEALIGPETVNTLPLETVNAFRDHGTAQLGLEHDVQLASWYLIQLSELNIDIDTVTQQLENEGIDKFNKPFDILMNTLAKKSQQPQLAGAAS